MKVDFCDGNKLVRSAGKFLLELFWCLLKLLSQLGFYLYFSFIYTVLTMQNETGFWSKRGTCQYHDNRNVFQCCLCRQATRGFTHNVLFCCEGCNNPDSLITRLNCASIKSRCLLTLQNLPCSFIKRMYFNYSKKQFKNVVKFELRSKIFMSAHRAGFILQAESWRMCKSWDILTLR